jgi:hypothetical protein
LSKDRFKTWAAMQTWAQNPGHESPTTTFGSYGKVATHDQGELVRNAGKQTQDTPDGKLDEIKSMIAQLQPRRARREVRPFPRQVRQPARVPKPPHVTCEQGFHRRKAMVGGGGR